MSVGSPVVNYFDYMEVMEKLNRYITQVRECENLPPRSQDREYAVIALNASVPPVNAVLAAIAPDNGQISAGSLKDHYGTLPLVEKALSLVDEAYQMLSQIIGFDLFTGRDEGEYDENDPPFGFSNFSDLPFDSAVIDAAGHDARVATSTGSNGPPLLTYDDW